MCCCIMANDDVIGENITIYLCSFLVFMPIHRHVFFMSQKGLIIRRRRMRKRLIYDVP